MQQLQLIGLVRSTPILGSNYQIRPFSNRVVLEFCKQESTPTFRLKRYCVGTKCWTHCRCASSNQHSDFLDHPAVYKCPVSHPLFIDNNSKPYNKQNRCSVVNLMTQLAGNRCGICLLSQELVWKSRICQVGITSPQTSQHVQHSDRTAPFTPIKPTLIPQSWYTVGNHHNLVRQRYVQVLTSSWVPSPRPHLQPLGHCCQTHI